MAALGLTPKAAERTLIGMRQSFVAFLLVELAIPTNQNLLGHVIGLGVKGLSLPGWALALIPSTGAIVKGIISVLGAHSGTNPDSVKLQLPVLSKKPAAVIDTSRVEFTTADHAADAATLDQRAVDRFAGMSDVQLVAHPADPVGPHGVNLPGETDPAPMPAVGD